MLKRYNGPFDSQEDEDAAYERYATLRAREASARREQEEEEEEEKKKKKKLLPIVD